MNPAIPQTTAPKLQPMNRSIGFTMSSGAAGAGSGSRPFLRRPQRNADQARRNPARVPSRAEPRNAETCSWLDGQDLAPDQAKNNSAGGARRSNSSFTYTQGFQVSVKAFSSTSSSGFSFASGGRTGPPDIPSSIIISFMTLTS